MNENIQTLNGGKPHKPIYKVRRTETSDGKQPIGANGNRSSKYVEAAKGTNLFFAVYSDGKGGRSFAITDLRSAINRKLQKQPLVPALDEKGNKLLFTLSPNDIVYVPKNGETTIEDKSRIYRLRKFQKEKNSCRAFFFPNPVAKAIVDDKEFLIELIDGVSIKNVCLPVEVDRLGNVTLKKIGEDD